jgi:murein DD-endopeptidase MepM/ murein hydrolase activator NlpD
VVIAPAGGGHLLIAHLKAGSVAVRPGDRVEEGQVMGACGNSGNSSEPHVHVHYQREHPRDVPPNFAEGLPLYFRDHRGAPMPGGGIRREGGRLIARGDVIHHGGR